MTLCTGRLPKDHAYCAALPQLSSFPLPEPWPNWSCTDIVADTLNEPSIGKLYPINGNDTMGDCTCAAASHGVTIQNGLAGTKIVPTTNSVISLYHGLGGRGMSGLQLTTVLRAWTQGIFGGQKILADVNIDTGNIKAVRQAIQYYGGVYIGFNTTSHTVSDFQNGKMWDAGGRSDGGGHCVYVTGYDDPSKTLRLLTWGGIQIATYDWWEQYVDEAHGILTPAAEVYDSATISMIQQAMPSLSV